MNKFNEAAAVETVKKASWPAGIVAQEPDRSDVEDDIAEGLRQTDSLGIFSSTQILFAKVR